MDFRYLSFLKPFSVTKEMAKELYAEEWWKDLDSQHIVLFQLRQNILCMPFDKFHQAVEKELERSVVTLEFAFDGMDKLFDELLIKLLPKAIKFIKKD